MRKTLLLATVLIFLLLGKSASAQDTASAYWKVNSLTTVPASSADTGQVSGATELTSNLDINMHAAYADSQRLTVPGGAWPAESEQNNSRYVQFAVSPNAGFNFTVTRISMRIGSTGGTNMKVNVYYSKDPNFTNPFAIYTAGVNFLPSGSMIGISASPGVILLDGEKLYVRIYPFYKSISTGKYLTLKNVFIAGSTTSFFIPPVVSTAAVTNVAATTAQSGGTISLEGGSAVTQKGVVWSTSANPTFENNTGFTTDGVGTGAYVSALNGLTPNTVYHVRAYATNSYGTSYGNDVQFATTLSTTNYYNKPTTDITNPANWGTNTDGTGAAPLDFSSSAQIFNIVTGGGTISSDWVVAGTDSKVIIGDGITPVLFTIPAAYALDGIVDVQANATLTIRNTVGLTFGILNSAATINFDGTNVVLVNYPNLGLLNGANFPNTGTVGISGIFNPGAVTTATVGSTISFIGTNPQALPTTFTYNILKLYNANTSFAGNLHVDSLFQLNENFVVNAADSLVLNPGAELFLAAAKTLTVNGAFDNRSLDAVTLNGNLIVSAGATYMVNANVGTSYLIPIADYKTGSELLILGGQPKVPATVSGNVTWASPKVSTFLNNTINTIGGNLTVIGGGINNGSSTGRILTIKGNLNIAGGQYTVGDFNSQATIVNGNINVTSGALYVESISDTSYLHVKGNIYHTGGILGFDNSRDKGFISFIGTDQTLSTTGLTGAAGGIHIGNDTTAPRVTFLSNVSIGGHLKIKNGSLTITPGKILTLAGTSDLNGKSLVLRSDSTGHAAIGPVANPILNGNNVTVEHYISALDNPALRLIAPSINTTGSIHDNWQTGAAGTATYITGSTAGLNGFDATADGAPSMNTYNVDITPTTDIVPAWINVPNTNTKKLEADSGYMVYIKGDRTLDIADSTVSNNTVLRSTGTLVTGTRTFNGLRASVYNLITNPYASAINWTGIHAANPDLADRYIYWDPNIGSRGGYVVVSGDGLTTPTLVTDNQGLNIQSGQAFFVRPLNTTSVTITESNKSTDNSHEMFRVNDGSTERLNTSLFFTTSNGTKRLADGVTSNYQNNYSTAIGAEDALQLANFDEDVSILSNSKQLAVEGRPLIDSTATIELNMTGLQAKKYEWQFAPGNFTNANLKAFLNDKFLGKLSPISLKVPTTIGFTITNDPASKATDRFQILFSAADIPVKLCPGGSTIITSDTLGLAYQWQLYNGSNFIDLANDANHQDVNSAALQINNAPSTMYGNRYRCFVTTVGGSAYSHIYSLAFTNTWLGISNKAWENPLNWSCGAIPDANTDVIFNTGMIEVNTSGICRSLQTKPGVSFKVQPGANFTITH